MHTQSHKVRFRDDSMQMQATNVKKTILQSIEKVIKHAKHMHKPTFSKQTE